MEKGKELSELSPREIGEMVAAGQVQIARFPSSTPNLQQEVEELKGEMRKRDERARASARLSWCIARIKLADNKQEVSLMLVTAERIGKLSRLSPEEATKPRRIGTNGDLVVFLDAVVWKATDNEDGGCKALIRFAIRAVQRTHRARNSKPAEKETSPAGSFF